ncbi:NAD(P)-binding domain-containing protein [Candidatus Frankia nodulisporulans]|uniref:NAD(P)-binding domain-containing protein n=1 Tax=Candidatus Frankia nodulisporulans TaxID=2060052 RepID=UPI0023EED289|nr:NAD(P)-binding domain-containing protein [Candidatus Frankia nodulisporulans]
MVRGRSPADRERGLRVGFVGVGSVGRPMLEQVVRAGHEVSFHARRPEVAREVAVCGATSVASPAELGAALDVAVVCVFSDAQVHEVCGGDDGLLATLPAGSTLVIHTTCSPETPTELARVGQARGVSVLDAAFSGGPADAAAGRVTLLVGGEVAVLERVRPVLASYASPILHVGGLGDGQRVKLVNNALFGANVALVAEAERLAGELGIDPARAIEAIGHCSGASYALGTVRAAGSSAGLHAAAGRYIAKDVATAKQLAAAAGTHLGLLATAADTLESAADTLESAADTLESAADTLESAAPGGPSPLEAGLPADTVGLLAGLTTTRAIRRYRDEPVPAEALRAILFAATRAPSGSNRQPFRFVVLADGPNADAAKRLVGDAARRIWQTKQHTDGYDRADAEPASPRARLARAMRHYVDTFEQVPVLILPCLVRYREPTLMEGASVYPACQNLLLAARALGYGGALTGFSLAVDAELRALLDVPEGTVIAGAITLGRPAGQHGPVRRRPLAELVYGETWGEAPAWAIDPPGTTFTAAGPPNATETRSVPGPNAGAGTAG